MQRHHNCTLQGVNKSCHMALVIFVTKMCDYCLWLYKINTKTLLSSSLAIERNVCNASSLQVSKINKTSTQFTSFMQKKNSQILCDVCYCISYFPQTPAIPMDNTYYHSWLILTDPFYLGSFPYNAFPHPVTLV